MNAKNKLVLMNKYTIYCTKEQIRKAYLLGAPIENKIKTGYYYNKEYPIKLNMFQYGKISTAEQICGWLREKYNIHIYTLQCRNLTYIPQANICNDGVITELFDWNYEEYFDSHQQAILIAIDVALDYLEKEIQKFK